MAAVVAAACLLQGRETFRRSASRPALQLARQGIPQLQLFLTHQQDEMLLQVEEVAVELLLLLSMRKAGEACSEPSPFPLLDTASLQERDIVKCK